MGAPSRPKRWQEALTKMQVGFDELEAGLSDLADLQNEYEEWLSNLPENLQNSGPLAEKLQAIVDLDINGVLDGVQDLMQEAEGMDLPRGFGKD